MDVIEGFLDSPDGMSLLADTNKYWSRIGSDDIRASKDARGRYTKFIVSKTDDNKLVLKADTGKFLSLNGGERLLKCNKSSADQWSVFDVYDLGDGRNIALRSREGLFLSRIGYDEIRGVKDGIDQYCKFLPGFGTFLDPQFEIIDVEVHGTADQLTWRADSVDQTVFVNKASNPISQLLTMTYTKKETEVTTWNRCWSCGIKSGFKVGVPGVSQTTFEMEITAGGGYGGSSSVTKTNTYTRKVEVIAAVRKKTTASLITKRSENAKVPFTATIRRKDADGNTRDFKEQGVWTGVVYSEVRTKVDEDDLEY